MRVQRTLTLPSSPRSCCRFLGDDETGDVTRFPRSLVGVATRAGSGPITRGACKRVAVATAIVHAPAEKEVMLSSQSPYGRTIGDRRAAEQIAADVRQRRRIDAEQRQQRRREVGLARRNRPGAVGDRTARAGQRG